MEETIDFLLKYSSHVEMDVRTNLGGARLDQMLCHRVCTYGRYFDINKRLFGESIEEDYAKCVVSNKMVQVSLNCHYSRKGRWYGDPSSVENFTVLVWGHTVIEALAKAETFYHMYGTEKVENHRHARKTDTPFILVDIPGVDDDNWSNKGS